jgi:carbonic anhydrase
MELTIEGVLADNEDGLADVRELLGEYLATLRKAVSTTRLTEEICDLPGPYAPPAGVLLLARAAGVPAGTVGLRLHHDDAAEMKRLYVLPAYRRLGVGRALAERAISDARVLGYRRLLLTTLPESMGPAIAVYESLGFRAARPFYDHSHVHAGVDMRFMELDLA